MTIQPICFPPAACNGGPLETAPPKVGEWVWQPKVDDWRAIIHAPSGTVWNQYGKLSSITGKFAVALESLHKNFSKLIMGQWLDVGMMENRHDLMRGCIIVFDLVEPVYDQQGRYGLLKQMFPVLPDVSTLLSDAGGQIRDEVYLISQRDSLNDYDSTWRYYSYLQDENKRIGHKFFEGVVAKKADSLYTFGRKPKQVTPDWIKHRWDQGGAA